VADVELEIDHRVATVTINRPAARNAIGLATIVELGAVLDEIADGAADVLVLRGGGDRAFISGGDLKELAAIRDEAGAAAMAISMRRLLDRIACFPVPVIAGLNGHALGGGAEVAVAADIRLAADDVQIGFSQVTLGIMPAWGGAERLVEIVGRSKAMLLVGLGRRLGAADAERLGLIDLVVPRADFDASLRELAESLGNLPPTAAAAIKAVIAAARPHVHRDQEAGAVAHFARLWASEEHWLAVDRMSIRAAAKAP